MIGRSLAVLDAFSQDRPALTLTEISRIAELPLPTAYRLVAELLTWGALERDDDGRLRIGLHLWEVASLAPRALGLREVAMPFIEDLFEATHQNVSLAVREGNEVVYVERVSGRGAVDVLARVGSRWPLHATGVGLVLLAHAPSDVRDAVLAGPLKAFTARTITDHRTLRAELAHVRKTGIAISSGQITLDVISVAAAVHDRTGTVVAGISLILPLHESPHERSIPLVRNAARGISASLGWTPSRAQPSTATG
jgi:DNA-binding IclR family transcriptional regulator